VKWVGLLILKVEVEMVVRLRLTLKSILMNIIVVSIVLTIQLVLTVCEILMYGIRILLKLHCLSSRLLIR
jgi:hypothetical protein